jgi:copper resistance protein B
MMKGIIKTALAMAIASLPLPALAMEGHGDMLIWQFTMDQLEQRWHKGEDSTNWKSDGFIGGDVSKLRLKSEGSISDSRLDDLEVQALYSVMVHDFWDFQAGIRQDFRPNPQTTHLAIGFQGLAPQFLEVDAQAFLSERGDVTARLDVETDLLLTQKLILQPHAEVELAAQKVAETETGAGISELKLGLRLRYEVVKEFAPYIGVAWERKLGDTARLAAADGHDANDLRFVTGLRFWF